MKEKIYTIPINEAFDENCGCPICTLEKKLETDAIEYTLGAAMMEPDFRIVTNDQGFCEKHYEDLIGQSKALPLSLILQSYVKNQNDLFSATAVEISKGGFMKKSSPKADIENIANTLLVKADNCTICNRIEHFMEQYLDNIVYLWSTENDFKKKFSNQNFYCRKHLLQLLNIAAKKLNVNNAEEFYQVIKDIYKHISNDIYEDISKFTKLFDHQTTEKPTENVKCAIKQAVAFYK